MNYTTIYVSLEKLILDPNNPRFSRSEYDRIDESMFSDPDVQADAMRKMVGDLNNFDIKSLEKSIKENGFHGHVHRILVKQIGEFFLVLEGNRRTTALKELQRKHNSGVAADRLSSELLEMMENIPVVDCTDLEKKQIDLLLGMAHIEGTKAWDLLPSSFHVYKIYAELLAKKHMWDVSQVDSQFVYDASVARQTAATVSTTSGKVKDFVRVYRVFKAISDEAFARTGDKTLVNHKKASLVQESFKGNVFEKYFCFDSQSFVVEDEGIERWLHLMTDHTGDDVIIENPNDLRAFKKVLTKGDDSHLDRVVQEREKPERVLADIMALENERSLNARLRTVKAELGKIDIDSLSLFAEADKELLDKIENEIRKIRAAANG